MVEVRYKEVELNKLFKNKRGNSNYTKKYCNANKGEYEVYTGTTIGSFGFINTYDYDEPLLTYTTDGENAATIKILSGKYNVGGHRAILFPKDENIVIDYFKWTLQKLFFDNVKKGDVPSITWSRIKDLEVTVPIDKNGNYDIEKQKEVVQKYEIVEEKKKELKEKLDYFKDVQVDFMATELSKSKNIKISELLNTKGGNNKLTNSFINSHKGIYPVYSAKTKGDVVKGYLDSYDYNIEAIQITRNGNAGVPIYHKKHKFSITEDARIFYKKEIYEDALNLEFLTLVIKNSIESKDFSWSNKAGINKLKDLEVCVPLNEDGTFDLEKQNQIVSKYKAIEEMKNSILEKGLPFTLSNVQFDGETPYIYIYIRVKDLFDIQRGKSIYTKTYCKNNKGEYPVYSADNNNPLGCRNEYDYNGKYLSSSINGIAGVLTLLDGKFSTNADRVVFIPKVENINLAYVKNILEPILRNKNKGRKGLKGKNEFTKLTPSMIEDEMIPIPYVAGTQWGNKKYMNMKHLEAALEDASIAG